jgi:hypothetical protein
MRTTDITTQGDRQWLVMTHLRKSSPQLMDYDFVIAVIHGNEDSPQKVELFKKDHYRCIPSVYEDDGNGTLVLNKVASKNAGKLRPRTAQEKKAGCL